MSAATTQNVVILGGGVGGQVVATRLKQRLGERARVVVVERSATFTFSPSLLWLMVGQRRPETITKDFSKLAARGVEMVRATVTGIDTGRSEVATEGATIGYDYLVVALGAEHDPALLPGGEHAHHPYDLAAATRLRDALARFGGGRVVVSVASLPYRCPAAPYETAMLIDGYLRDRGRRDRSTIDLYTPEPLPMPVAGGYIGHSVAAELAARQIAFHPRSAPSAVGPDSITFDGAEVGYDLAVVIPPHRPPVVIASSGLAGPSGWVAVDRASLRTQAAANVYAIGDVTGIPLENGMMLPKAGTFAHGEAEVVARNIASRIAGDQGDTAFDGHGTCFLEVGGGKAGLARGDFFASPAPAVAMQRPGRLWHVAKVGFEQYWLRRWI